MSKYYMVVDRGTTNVKSSLFDTRFNEIAVTSVSCPVIETPYPGWAENDMEAMWETSVSSIKKLFALGYDPKDVICIGMSGQGNGLFLVDKAGQPVRKGILSLDSRARDICRRFMEDSDISTILDKYYLSCFPDNTLPKLKWVQENEPEVYKKAAHFMFSKDWIRFRLTGEIYSDYTDVSGAGLMNLSTREYVYELFDSMGMPEAKAMVPEVIESFSIAGYVTEEASAITGLVAGTPVACGCHDFTACTLGSGGLEEGHIVSIFGTYGLNTVLTRDPTKNTGFHLCSSIPGMYLSITALPSCGSTLDRMVSLLFSKEKYMCEKEGAENPFALINDRLIDRTPSSIIFLPYLFGGFGTNFRGAFSGMGSWHDKYDIMLGVYQGLTAGLANSITPLTDLYDKKEIWFVGGGAKSAKMGQLLANMTGKTINTTTTQEVVSRGVALYTAMSQGQITIDDREAIGNISIRAIYKPDKDYEFCQKYLEIFNRMTKDIQPVWNDQLVLEKWNG